MINEKKTQRFLANTTVQYPISTILATKVFVNQLLDEIMFAILKCIMMCGTGKVVGINNNYYKIQYTHIFYK